MYSLLKITEVTEVERDLSIEERCMISVVYSNCYGGCIDEDFRKAAKDRLAEIGFVQYVDQLNTRGVFRNTTTRLATEVETIAWHCTQIKKECDMIGGSECAKCPKFHKFAGCVASSDDVISMAILDGKTISVEYFEE